MSQGNKIGEKTLTEVGDLIGRGLSTHHIHGINLGYKNAGEKDFKISISVTINPGAAPGNHKIKADVSYQVEKITDSFSSSVDELQTELFDEEKGALRRCPLRPDAIGVYENTVCKKCKKRVDLIFVSGTELPRIISPDELPAEMKPGQMLQHYVCPSWADEFYKEWSGMIISREITPKPEKKPEKKANTKFKKIAGGKR